MKRETADFDSDAGPTGTRRRRWKTNRFLHWLLRLRGSPEAIGLGVAIGLFVAFTPTIGLQMIIATVLATLLNANRLAAIGPVWLTNPFTIPPLFLLTYWVGSFLWPGPSVATIRHTLGEALRTTAEHHFWEIFSQFAIILNLGRDIFLCLLLGGMLVGAVCGGLSYLPTVWLIRRLRGQRQRPATG
ncbi:MAG: DUF2062 domain-containing protein [Planctomycetales bacterium]|nr:DUF2062 domain-containing protein [Planctomycetales bacterium]NIM08437.1 DUF2062 domain-containing protein [Planctomycetales bacterium]NIN07913.1 DUF2062 domain-containing protein [Planctomycetales bacterium]NIN77043.1 DUF2062 domain-containing protein [Planctomycetales bacterium]NIO34228.1 DUF2062 domain-containing protein [Planctomycetales bacterium]